MRWKIPQIGPEIARAISLGLALVAITTLGCSRREAAPRPASPGHHRIVSLTPSATEIVAALGDAAQAELVGTDRYSEYPDLVKHLPKVGDFLSPDVEGILALRPDIAILDSVQTPVRDKLQAAGITVVLIDMHTLADVNVALSKVGAALGRENEARAAQEQAGKALEAIAAQARQRGQGQPRPKVLVIIDRQPGGLGGLYAAGPGTFIDELLRLLGADNALAHSPVRYSQLAPEYVVSLAPDVIIDASPVGASAEKDFAVLGSVPAVQHGRVHALLEPTLQAPGPRASVGAARLLPLLWPSP